MNQRLASIFGLGLSLTVAFSFPAQQAAAQPATVGAWASDHGSVLVIQSVGPDGRIADVNNVPGYKCAGVGFPVVGWMDGQRISYTVRWKNASLDCASITSWTGYFSDGRLGVEWVLAYEESGASKVRIGSDSYRRQ